MSMKNKISFELGEKTFPARNGKPPFTAVSDVNLKVREGEFLTVVGPSGCGKSTLLDMLGGLTKPTKGRLRKYGRYADDLKVMPGVFITVAKTEEEARAKQQQLSSYILPEVCLKYLSGVTDSDFSQYDIDDAFPLDAPNADPSNPQTRYHVIRDLAV